MKKVFSDRSRLFGTGPLIVAMVFLSACQFLGVNANIPNPMEPDPACTVYEDYKISDGSVIKHYIPNPCAASNILVTVAKSGVALEAYKIEEFKAWVDIARRYITAGLTFGDLKLWLSMEVMKLNKQFGLTMLVLSDLLLVIPDAQVLHPDDVKLCEAAMVKLVAAVEQMAIFYSYGESGRMPICFHYVIPKPGGPDPIP